MHQPAGRGDPGPRRALGVCTRLLVGAAILAVLVQQVGTRPFLEALHRLDAWSLALAAGIAVVTTVCCAWRWRLVSHGLGSDLPLRGAVAAYYRSQFLNTVVPGGIVGDVHRAVRHGRDVGSVGHGVRGVVLERSAGQVVQVALTLALLLVLPSPVRSALPLVTAAVTAVALAVVWLGRTALPDRLVRIGHALATDVRDGLLAPGIWPGVVLSSTVVVAGHTATFLVAARTAGSEASLTRMLPLALLVLLAMSVPTHVAGWGPREGVAAWAFALAGLGAAQGVTTAAVYGVMALVATLPGAAVLAAGWARPAGQARPARPAYRRSSVAAEGAAHG